MYELLLIMILVLLVLTQGREHFLGFLPDALKFGGNDWYSTDPKDSSGYEVYSSTPHSCYGDKPELDAGLCYERCKPGYHGVGPVCWADSVNVGEGIPVGLEPCPDGWSNDGLICREPIHNDCSWKGLFGECWGRLRGGKLKGRLDGGGVCSGPGALSNDHPDRVAGLCYKRCPKNLPERIPGMPYLCYRGGPLSYGRGVGRAPPMLRLGGTYPLLQL